MRVHFFFHPHKYFPYEKELARREITTLIGDNLQITSTGIIVEDPCEWKKNAAKLTYFKEAGTIKMEKIVPLQTYLEASAKINHKTTISKYIVPNLYRQSTRYSAHGIHEYRGKFNPQIVRAIGNILHIKNSSWILDPFCGSGTTLLESVHCGWNAIGVDLNPLGVYISQAKIATMNIPTDILRSDTELLKERLIKKYKKVSYSKPFIKNDIEKIIDGDYKNYLFDYDYLSKWFKESVLIQLVSILQEIDNVDTKQMKHVFRVFLSDILRRVSLQDERDLRIRRKKNPPENESVIPKFIDNLSLKVNQIISAKHYLKENKTYQEAFLGDSRSCSTLMQEKMQNNNIRFNAAITSPPYATALPYIDTHRLSLVFLGLRESKEIMNTQKSLIGSREINRKVKEELENDMLINKHNLPSDCISFCLKLKQALNTETDGFRRQNKPALIYKYLTDMDLMFEQVYRLLKKNSYFALVIGRNTTKIGGEDYIIDTPKLLASIAKTNKFTIKEMIELNTYQRFGIHKSNSIKTETLLILQST